MEMAGSSNLGSGSGSGVKFESAKGEDEGKKMNWKVIEEESVKLKLDREVSGLVEKGTAVFRANK